MNFDLSEDQRLLVETVAAFVKKQSPVTRLRSLREDATGWDRKVWRQMAEYGWLGVMFPEDVGGAGGSFVDASLIIEVLGTTLVPEPVVPALVAGHVLQAAGNTEQRQRWLAPMIEGKTSLALAAAERQSRFDVANVETRATRTGSGWRLSGEKRWVLNGHAAETLVVSARTAGGAREAAGVSLFVIEPGTQGVTVTPAKTMDGHHAAMVTLAEVDVDADRLLGAEGAGAGVLEAAMDLGAAAACAEGAGIMRTVLWMTVEYLRTREQFGVKIGTFQGLQHRAVDMFVETELCKSMALMAAIKASEPDADERRSGVSAAKVQLAVGGKLVTQQAIQLHGGIGVTDEHDVGLYFKRMHILNTLYGDEEHHLARFAAQPSFVAGVEHG